MAATVDFRITKADPQAVAIFADRLWDARAFWNASSTTRYLIRHGRVSEAAPIIRCMREAARFLLEGSPKDQALGLRLRLCAQDTFAQMAAAKEPVR